MIDHDGKLHFYLNDHLGSARMVIDTAGTVKDNYDYYAFGEALDQTISTGQSYRYTGKPFDNDHNLNLHYYGARYYDGTIGRFISVDPLAAKHPGLTPYHYAANNPLAFLDPFGLDTLYYNSYGDLLRTDAGGDKNVVFVDSVQLIDQAAREQIVTQTEGASSFKETGGVVYTDAVTGEQIVVKADDPTTEADPCVQGADIDVYGRKDKTLLQTINASEPSATYHSHPRGVRVVAGGVCSFDQVPSAEDFHGNGNAATNYMLSESTNLVYIWDKSGALLTTFPMDCFGTVGR